MLKSMGKSKKCIFWMAAFGLTGLIGVLLAPVVVYIIKVAKRYPKTFGRITTAAFVGGSIGLHRHEISDDINYTYSCRRAIIPGYWDKN